MLGETCPATYPLFINRSLYGKHIDTVVIESIYILFEMFCIDFANYNLLFRTINPSEFPRNQFLIWQNCNILWISIFATLGLPKVLT